MHQHDDAATVGEPRQERQPVLGVDHHVGPHPAQRPETDAGQHHRQPGPDVDRVRAACPVDPHPVDDFVARGTRITRRPQRHIDTRLGQLGADALQVCLAAAALWMAGVAPAQQQH